MKGAMGGALVLLEVVERDESFPGRLIVTFVTDEEHSSIATIPGETEEQVRGEEQVILDRLTAEDEQFRADLTMGLFRSPWAVGRDEEIVQVLAETYREETGGEIVYDGAAGWMDTALLAEVGVPAVVFGPDGDGSHAVVEWVDLDTIESYTRILAKVAYAFCGGSEA